MNTILNKDSRFIQYLRSGEDTKWVVNLLDKEKRINLEICEDLYDIKMLYRKHFPADEELEEKILAEALPRIQKNNGVIPESVEVFAI